MEKSKYLRIMTAAVAVLSVSLLICSASDLGAISAQLGSQPKSTNLAKADIRSKCKVIKSGGIMPNLPFGHSNGGASAGPISFDLSPLFLFNKKVKVAVMLCGTPVGNVVLDSGSLQQTIGPNIRYCKSIRHHIRRLE